MSYGSCGLQFDGWQTMGKGGRVRLFLPVFRQGDSTAFITIFYLPQYSLISPSSPTECSRAAQAHKMRCEWGGDCSRQNEQGLGSEHSGMWCQIGQSVPILVIGNPEPFLLIEFCLKHRSAHRLCTLG